LEAVQEVFLATILVREILLQEYKLGNMNMYEYNKMFLELLIYVSFIRDENIKI
jgi:hypothetical protein